MRINFQKNLLEPVKAGAKTVTIRTWPPSWKNRVRPGDEVLLAFGRRDRPTLIPATIEAVELFDLGEELKYLRRLHSRHGKAKRRLALRKLVGRLERDEGLYHALAKSIPTDDESEIWEAFLGLLEELAFKKRSTAFAIAFRVHKS